MRQDVSHYDLSYYQRNIPENWFWRHGLLRPDQLAAYAYAHNWPFFGNEARNQPEHYGQPRDPGRIMSIGVGRGTLEREFELNGYQVTAVDPSPVRSQIYEGKGVVNEAIPLIMVPQSDTVIFCESIEHVPEEQIFAVVERMHAGARLIIVNWVDYHPIVVDEPAEDGSPGWDHITTIDDDFYMRLAAYGKIVIHHGSHFVLDRVA